jgi:branched-chain amino acid aminotransferase
MTTASRQKPRYVWLDSQIVPYESAKIHALSTAFKYAAIVYEGLRGYWNHKSGQLYIFRVADHLRRLEDSAKVARMVIPASSQEIETQIVELVRANKLRQDLHIRILVYVAADDGSLDSTDPVGTVIATMPMGRYPEIRQAGGGLNVCVSHWRRNSDDGSPLRVKTTGNYFNSRLALLQARDGGYDDAIIVDSAGKVTEGPGYNIFLARAGQLATPAVTNSILEGVTRDTIIRLYHETTGSAVSERAIDKSELYLADELFYCGSGKEVCAICSVDGIELRQETPGEITRSISESYFAVARGDSAGHKDWLTAVY